MNKILLSNVVSVCCYSCRQGVIVTIVHYPPNGEIALCPKCKKVAYWYFKPAEKPTERRS